MAYPIWKKRWKRRIRLLFPSPAEARWAEIMGAIVIRVPRIHKISLHRDRQFPLTIIIPWGWYRSNYIEREIIIRGYHLDFGNRRMRMAIEIDGRNYHDVVDDYERDEALLRSGWRVMRIPAARLGNVEWVADRCRRWLV